MCLESHGGVVRTIGTLLFRHGAGGGQLDALSPSHPGPRALDARAQTRSIQQSKASECHVQYTYVNLVLPMPAALGPPFVVVSERVAQSEREAQ